VQRYFFTIRLRDRDLSLSKEKGHRWMTKLRWPSLCSRETAFLMGTRPSSSKANGEMTDLNLD
jgi:hypothetical protein